MERCAAAHLAVHLNLAGMFLNNAVAHREAETRPTSLAFNDSGTLMVSGPTTSANESIHAIEPDGGISSFYTGLGRPQGMAFDVDGNLYVAASLHGRRGVVKITPLREASLAISGSGIVGLAFLPGEDAAVVTRDTVYHIGLDIAGRLLR